LFYTLGMIDSVTLQPVGLDAYARPGSRALAGGRLHFRDCVLGRRGPDGVEREIVSLGALPPAAAETLERLCQPRPPLGGVALDSPAIMGIVNVTPDSFSDGGDRFDSGRAVADGLSMAEEGAAWIDVGGDSTRPGAGKVPLDEELRRVLPVVEGLAKSGVKVSIDTRHAQVMAAAADAGAALINDVAGLRGPGSLEAAARSGLPVVLMHMQGEPRSMQRAPGYDDVASDVYDFLAERVAACEAAGIERSRIAVDPGIGFGKTVAHNLELIERLALFQGLGCAVLLGASRKSFIGRLSRGEDAKARMPGSLAVALAGVARGAQVLRVHDVAETRQAITLWQALIDPPAD
jgi:dihydropteroate synthase